MIRKRSTWLKNASRPSTKWCAAAPSRRERSPSSAAAAPLRPPVSTVTVTTGRPWLSARNGTQKEVSNPPEKARTIGSVMASALFEEGGETAEQPRLVALQGGGDEHRVVPRDRADHLR